MTAVRLIISEQTIEAFSGQTVLEAARSHGLIIPTLCDHPDLTPVGSCRLCVVEVDGWRGEVTACTQPVRQGMVVRTQTPGLERSRRMVLELLLRHYHDAGYAANDRAETEFEHWVRQYQAQPPAGFGHEARYPVDSDPNPFVWVDLNKCILCTRCVRACAEIQGRFVWGVGRRGAETKIIAGSGPPRYRRTPRRSIPRILERLPAGASQIMTEAQIKEAILKILGRIAPEANFDTLDPDANIREALDIDSFDHLNLVIGLNEELGVEISEADYGQLTTITDIISYLAARMR